MSLQTLKAKSARQKPILWLQSDKDVDYVGAIAQGAIINRTWGMFPCRDVMIHTAALLCDLVAPTPVYRVFFWGTATYTSPNIDWDGFESAVKFYPLIRFAIGGVTPTYHQTCPAMAGTDWVHKPIRIPYFSVNRQMNVGLQPVNGPKLANQSVSIRVGVEPLCV